MGEFPRRIRDRTAVVARLKIAVRVDGVYLGVNHSTSVHQDVWASREVDGTAGHVRQVGGQFVGSLFDDLLEVRTPAFLLVFKQERHVCGETSRLAERPDRTEVCKLLALVVFRTPSVDPILTVWAFSDSWFERQ